ncbi:ClcB-like voltage-gated chloride channel protein [Uliginosibacterium sp. sgz301328]|uniref:ClcB-like voltage-gated chloride channel protein n=1 Tax=Uliginosibacterium sp. sgz301328 TaxID=3243764 RepID=UPI00359E6084
MPWPRTGLKLWLLERLMPGEMQRTLWIAALIGFFGALATVAFREVVALLEHLLYGQQSGLVEAAMSLPPLVRLMVPTIGGLVAGFLLLWSRRYGAALASDYMEAISLKDGALSTRQSLLRAASSIVTIASGASIGREGSMVQLSALVGSWIGQWRNMPAPRRRLLVACGGAAGITAAYNAPIAGALFIAEIVLRSIAVESLGPLVVASVVANITVHGFLDYGPVYHMPVFEQISRGEIALHGLLGVVAGLLSPWFLWLLESTRAAFRRLPWPLPARLALGGVIVGLISVWRPEVWGNGYSVVNGILANQWMWQAVLLILVSKVFATAATTGSGAVGGVFTPTLFVGAALGFLFGEAAHGLWPELAPSPVFAAIGMAAFLSGTTHAPLTAILMIFEMTGSYGIMLPLMLASVLAYFVSRLQRERSVYSDALKPDRASAFAYQQAASVLRHDPPTVGVDATLAECEQAFVASRWQHVYVTDGEGRFVGAVSLHDLGPLLRAGSDPQQAIPVNLLLRGYPRVRPDMSLGSALGVFASHPGERLPVVDALGMLQGYVSKTDLLLMLQEGVAQG